MSRDDGRVFPMHPPFIYANVFLICFLGVLTSYSDLKKGIIENRLVFPAIALSFALALLNQADPFLFLPNVFLAFIFGFMLWLAGLWSAGDAKLFLAFAALFPTGLFPNTLPAFSILLNSFLPAFLLLLAVVLAKTTARQKREALRQALSPRLVASVAVFLFAFYWLLDAIFSVFGLQLDFFSTAILLFAIVAGVESLFPKKSFYLFLALSATFLAFRLEAVATPDFLAFFAGLLAISVFLLFFALRLGLSCFGRPKPILELKPGMVLLEVPFEKNNVIEKKKPFLPSLVNIFLEAKEKPFLETGPRGLTKEDLEKLWKAKSEKRVNFDKLQVQETLPFAPIIFAGTLLSFFTPLFFTV